jgi:hypothetical protein
MPHALLHFMCAYVHAWRGNRGVFVILDEQPSLEAHP